MRNSLYKAIIKEKALMPKTVKRITQLFDYYNNQKQTKQTEYRKFVLSAFEGSHAFPEDFIAKISDSLRLTEGEAIDPCMITTLHKIKDLKTRNTICDCFASEMYERVMLKVVNMSKEEYLELNKDYETTQHSLQDETFLFVSQDEIDIFSKWFFGKCNTHIYLLIGSRYPFNGDNKIQE